jgi:hemoglobin
MTHSHAPETTNTVAPLPSESTAAESTTAKSTTAATPSVPTLYDRIGGESALREIVTRFVQRFQSDMIIGFFFAKVDPERLIQHEFEHASQHLGGPHTYQGRPIGSVHRPHRINAGQFHRRLWIVEQTLRTHLVDEDIIQAWLDHERKFFNTITQDRQCVEPTPPKNTHAS